MDGFGLSNLKIAGEADLIAAYAKLDNVVVDMAICDALQDEDFSRRVGYERAAYCDSRNLSDYKLLGTEQLWRSFERGDDSNDPGVKYHFESNGRNKTFAVKRFLANNTTSPRFVADVASFTGVSSDKSAISRSVIVSLAVTRLVDLCRSQ